MKLRIVAKAGGKVRVFTEDGKEIEGVVTVNMATANLLPFVTVGIMCPAVSVEAAKGRVTTAADDDVGSIGLVGADQHVGVIGGPGEDEVGQAAVKTGNKESAA